MLLYNLFRNSFHTKDFNIEASTIRQGIFDSGQIFLVDLIHVDIEA